MLRLFQSIDYSIAKLKQMLLQSGFKSHYLSISRLGIVKPILINFLIFLSYFSGVNCPGQSCANELNIEEQPLTVFTNTTSFVGIKAQINPVCKCSSVSHLNRWQSCLPNPCSNNGTCEPLVSGGYKCNCPADNPDQFGPNCQILASTYNGKGMFNTKQVQNILFILRTHLFTFLLFTRNGRTYYLYYFLTESGFTFWILFFYCSFVKNNSRIH